MLCEFWDVTTHFFSCYMKFPQTLLKLVTVQCITECFAQTIIYCVTGGWSVTPLEHPGLLQAMICTAWK